MVDTRISYAQNGEDVILFRALGHLPSGRYVDVGANHPVDDSVSWLFYQQGWRGVDVEPVDQFASLLESTRPGNAVVRAVVGDAGEGEATFHEVVGTGLSTSDGTLASTYAGQGYDTVTRSVPTTTLDALSRLEQARDADGQTHFLKVDVEGDEAAVLRSADLRAWRPWVVVVEATRPRSTRTSHEEWEPDLLAAGYRFCLFDGLSRYYVAEEHAELAPALSYPFCPLDDFVTAARHDLEESVARLGAQVAGHDDELAAVRDSLRLWRGEALRSWGGGVGREVDEDTVRVLEAEVHALRTSTSWRLTAPVRALGRLLLGRP